MLRAACVLFDLRGLELPISAPPLLSRRILRRGSSDSVATVVSYSTDEEAVVPSPPTHRVSRQTVAGHRQPRRAGCFGFAQRILTGIFFPTTRPSTTRPTARSALRSAARHGIAPRVAQANIDAFTETRWIYVCVANPVSTRSDRHAISFFFLYKYIPVGTYEVLCLLYIVD